MVIDSANLQITLIRSSLRSKIAAPLVFPDNPSRKWRVCCASSGIPPPPALRLNVRWDQAWPERADRQQEQSGQERNVITSANLRKTARQAPIGLESANSPKAGKTMPVVAAILVLAGALVAVPAPAQQFPAKPVRLIVPFVAGGTADVLSRVLAQRLTQQYAQQVVVENRPGSGGHVGAEAAARAAPDGYTIVFGTIGIHAAYEIYSKLNYDPARDLQAVVLYADMPCVLIVHPSVPARNVKEFIALAQKNPGRLNFGTAGSGSSTHMVAEWFKLVTGVNLTHIPYKGSAQAMQDLLGGQIELMFENLTTGIAQIKAGKVRALGMTSKGRSPSMPEVPTIAEAGVPGFEATAWFTIAAPAKVPADIVRKLNADMNAFFKSPEMQSRWVDMGLVPVGGSPADAEKFFVAEREKWNKVIKAAGIRGD
jgi:tripartite-type tricarboxylate transporter receptor subunit TctC